MKKLGIALAVVAMAACAQAARVQWQMSATKADAANGDGNMVYMILASDWDGTTKWASGEAIAAASVAEAKFTVGGKSATTPATPYMSADLAVGDTLDYYLVMVDSTSGKYFSSGLQTSNPAVADGVNDKDPSGAVIAAVQPSSKIYAAGSALADSKNWSGGAPEPTSAMLMLLGAAGLALKRKRA